MSAAGNGTPQQPRAERRYYCGCCLCLEQYKSQPRGALFIAESTWYSHRKARERQIIQGKIPRPLPGTIEAVAPHKSRVFLKRRRNRAHSEEPPEKRTRQDTQCFPAAAGASGGASIRGARLQGYGGMGNQEASGNSNATAGMQGAAREPQVGTSRNRERQGGHRVTVEDVPEDDLGNGGESFAEDFAGAQTDGNARASRPAAPVTPRADLEVPASGVSMAEVVKFSLDFIHSMRGETLETSGLDKATIERLRDPPTSPPTFSPHERHAINLWIRNDSCAKYTSNREVAVDAHPEDSALLSYHEVQKKIAELTGITPIVHDMCPNTCMAYTGPWKDRDHCINPECRLPRYQEQLGPNGKRIPRRTWCTFPPGPQVQARWRSPEGAHEMGHRERVMQDLLEELLGTEGLGRISDLYHGSNFYERYQRGEIGADDFVLIYSMDGAQLYEHKASHCWIYIWILVDVSPDRRYKRKYILPGAIVPGPNKPKYPDSFNYPGFAHLSALGKEGMRVYDGLDKRVFTSFPFLYLAEMDAVGAPEVHGWCPHGSKKGCRHRCGIIGRRKPGQSHYYAANLRPDHYNEPGCLHDDTHPSQLPEPQTEEQYVQEVYQLAASSNYVDARLELGMVKPSIVLGIPRARRSDIPDIFCGDIMHSSGLNIPDHVQKLMRGLVECDEKMGDERSNWDWIRLTGEVWEEHGRFIEKARQYIPTCFGRASRNPCRKVKSGYKCEEFTTWQYGLFPALTWGVLKDEETWKHNCTLVAGTRVAFQKTASYAELNEAHAHLADWKYKLESEYAQFRTSRLHFMPQCTHLILHHADSYRKIGPLICSSQFPIERTIGLLGGELRKPSDPYANLNQRALRMCRMNALLTMYPELDPKRDAVISKKANLTSSVGNGYFFLHPRDSRATPGRKIDELYVILDWLREAAGDDEWEDCWEHAHNAIRKWSRCYLPNGQVARSRMKEVGKRRAPRISRNVKYRTAEGKFNFAEVYYYFSIPVGKDRQPRAVALVSLYGNPDPHLLQASSGVVWAAPYEGEDNLAIIEVSSILSVVGMIPHDFDTPTTDGVQTLWFVLEKLGAERDWVGDIEEDLDDKDDDDGDESRDILD